MKVRRILLGLLAPIGALAFALLVSSAALLLIDVSPRDTFSSMAVYGACSRAPGFAAPCQPDSIISIVNRAVPLFISGLAVAIGFKMGLFNIGVEGQYRLAALLAAAAGAAVALPAALHVALVIVVGMLVGAFWAGIPGVLKVTRGVHEVISTIMLNFVATGLGAYLLANYLREDPRGQELTIETPAIPPSARLPSLNPLLGVESRTQLFSFVIFAVVLAFAFYFLVWRTRYGYDLRASGMNPGAAQASGVDPNSMVIRTMLISGGIAGLVGMSELLGFFHRYTLDFPVGLGFEGIAVALVGRNHPFGIALGALLFGFVDRSAQILDLTGVPKEIIVIMKGVIILSVVIAYEIVRRLILAQEVRAAAEQTEEPTAPPPEPELQRVAT